MIISKRYEENVEPDSFIVKRSIFHMNKTLNEAIIQNLHLI